MKNIFRVFRALVFGFTISAAFQVAAAESSLYLFKKSATDGFTAVEAVQEEKLEGILKLTRADGKVVAWQESMLSAKFGLFDEATQEVNGESLENVLAEMERFMASEPASKEHLQPLATQWKAYLIRNKTQAIDNERVKHEAALAVFLLENHQADGNYELDWLEAKERQGEELARLLPDQVEKIEQYLRPWIEERKNRQSGLVRYQGKWVSPEEIAREKAARLEAGRKTFVEKELVFTISNEAVSQKTVYLSLALFGVSVLVLLGMFLSGLTGLFRSPGAASFLSLGIGALGLAAYGFGISLILQKPPSYAGGDLVLPKALPPGERGAMVLEDLIFSIHQPAGSEAPVAPVNVVIEDPSLNSFLRSYVKLESKPPEEPLALLRQGLKVQVQGDRILIFDEMKWRDQDLVACYTLYFSDNGQGFQFGRTEAVLGGLPMPGRFFKHLWKQVEPLMGSIVTRSRILENYYIKRMNSGEVEMVSNRAASQQASR